MPAPRSKFKSEWSANGLWPVRQLSQIGLECAAGAACMMLAASLCVSGPPRSVAASNPNADNRPMTVRDVLSVREIAGQAISSDGGNVAFIVKDAQISTNDYKYTLF